MGVVYRAEDTRLKRTVALKFLPHEVSDDPRAKERFLREAQAASRLDHPSICTIHEIGETEGGQLYIVMAFYRGETLKQRIARGPLTVAEALDVAWQIAGGLAHAHAQDVVHRDVKPANVLLIDEGRRAAGVPALSSFCRVKLLDFGLAKMAGDTVLTRTGSSIGTPLYMSPEQIGGASDARTDIWSLGVLFYEMLTGTRPFGGGNSATAMYSILHREPSPLALTPGMPDDLQPILDRALAKDVDQRYPTASELADDLAAVASAEMSVTQVFVRAPPARPMLAVAAGASPARPPRHRSRRSAALGAALALSVAALALAMARRPVTPVPTRSAAAPDVVYAASPRTVAVLPFTFRGRDEFAYLSEGMVDLLATKLDGAGDLRSIDPRALLAHLRSTEQAAAAPLDPQRAARIGQRFGADLVLLGNAVEVAGQLHLNARLYCAASAVELASAAAEGPAAEIFSLVDRIAAELWRQADGEIHGPAPVGRPLR